MTVDDSIEIVVDGVILHVRKGERLIDAAERHGISIPRLCYREGASMGACYVCVVAATKRTGRAVLRSCLEHVKPGMVVSRDVRGGT